MSIGKAAPVLIVGAGIAGLTLARLLQNAGIANIVFEQSGRERAQGFSISLRDWGFEALLNALDDASLTALQRCVAPDRNLGGSGELDQLMRDNSTGNVIITPDASQLQTVVRANRNALRDWISDCGEDELDIRYNHKLKTIQGTLGNVVATFQNGSKHRGSVLIAADGVNSQCRALTLPQVVPQTLPALVYHGELSMTHDEFRHSLGPWMANSNILAGVGDGFNTPITVCNTTRSHVHLDWSYSRAPRKGEDLPGVPTPTTDGCKQAPQALLEELGSLNLAAPWRDILSPSSVQTHSVVHWASRSVWIDRKDLASAKANGVVFVGDAWHAMPIFGGEGGNHAMLDAVQLAENMSKHKDADSAIEAYYSRASTRCEDAVRRSRQRFHILHRPISEWYELAEKRKLAMSGKKV
ncbi:hypothetical protein PRZ48_005349 [Zasmidium cellare]|uniref:FAD-binding domain-containing protein n=1 Tax=Zasmidium cellare TaxID=395010 RepID=A0ABR0ETP0_ZASCE|nr:hypothetical protein PRZ48_005349 [Zasmidium cellare]